MNLSFLKKLLNFPVLIIFESVEQITSHNDTDSYFFYMKFGLRENKSQKSF